MEALLVIIRYMDSHVIIIVVIIVIHVLHLRLVAHDEAIDEVYKEMLVEEIEVLGCCAIHQ